MNGDSYCEVDLGAMLAWHGSRRAEATIALTRRPDARGFGRVSLDPDGCLTGFQEKTDEPGAAWVNAGIYLLSRAVLESIPAERPVSVEHDVFPRWVGRGLFGYRAEGAFIDIGTPDSYAAARSVFARSLA
jgi:NDP-sugar pyrophosphorylase family protein